MNKKFKVLFLCTGNSARSILGEYIIKKIGKDRFESFSAGSNPIGKVHPLAIQVLKEIYEINASDARSKSFREFQDVPLDFIITVCDNARESCPTWPKGTITAHWGVKDPADFEGSEADQFRVFKDVAAILKRRIELFSSLPFSSLDSMSLQKLTREIGQDIRN